MNKKRRIEELERKIKFIEMYLFGKCEIKFNEEKQEFIKYIIDKDGIVRFETKGLYL